MGHRPSETGAQTAFLIGLEILLECLFSDCGQETTGRLVPRCQVLRGCTTSMNTGMSTETLVIVIIGVSLAFLLMVIVRLAMLSVCAQQPKTLGLVDNQFVSCPVTPNCVSTHSTSPQHASDPIRFSGSAGDAFTKLQAIVEQQPRTRIITVAAGYMHVEFTSRIFHFVDDVQFLFDENQQVIHFRSSSRSGYSDLGVNRHRMESLRTAFENADQTIDSRS